MRRESYLKNNYRPLQWLQSQSGQYIDTCVQPDDSMVMKIRAIVQYAATAYSGICFEGDNWNTNDMLGFTVHNSNRYFKASRAGTSNINNYFYFTSGQEVEMELQKASFIVRNLTNNTSNTTTFAQRTLTNVHRNIWIFKGNTNNADMSNFTKLKIESVIFNSNVAANRRNYVPMLRIADSKPGLLDLEGSICPLTGTSFYINAGTGEFLYA